MKLYMIRHGQSVANTARTFTGQMDVPLTEEGYAQARRLQPYLSNIDFQKVYSSDLCRTVQTQACALPDVTAEQTPVLREFDVGNLEGKPYACGRPTPDSPAPASTPQAYAPFGGESRQMVRKRVCQFLRMLEQDPCENVAAFTHKGVMLTMLRYVMDMEIPTKSVVIGNCAVCVFDFDGSKWRLVSWNCLGAE